MSELTPEASRLYRVRKTTVKMLHNRGYIVSENELVMTPEAFQVQVSASHERVCLCVCVFATFLATHFDVWFIFDPLSF